MEKLVIRSPVIRNLMILVLPLAKNLILFSCPSEAFEGEYPTLGLEKEPTGLQDFLSKIDLQCSKLENTQGATSNIPIEKTWVPSGNHLDLALSLGRDSSQLNAQETKLKANNLMEDSICPLNPSRFSWPQMAYPHRSIAWVPQDQLVPKQMNHLNHAQDSSTELFKSFSTNDGYIPALQKPLTDFVCQEGSVPPPPSNENRWSREGRRIPYFENPTTAMIGGLQTKRNWHQSFPDPLSEDLSQIEKRQKIHRGQISELPAERTGNYIHIQNMEEPYPEERLNLAQLQLHPDLCIIPFTFSTQWCQDYFEAVQYDLYDVKRFVYGKTRRPKISKKDYARFHKMIWTKGVESGRQELNSLGLPTIPQITTHPRVQNEGESGETSRDSLNLTSKFFKTKEWVVSTLPQTIHDIRVLCKAFPRVLLDTKRTVKQLQRNACYFFCFFQKHIDLIYENSEEVNWWITKSKLPHSNIRKLIDKINGKSLQSKGYSNSPGVSRCFLLLWMSFYCKELHSIAEGSNEHLNLRFGGLLNQFY